MTQSYNTKQRVELNEVGLFADGAAVRVVGEETFRVALPLIDEMVNVDNDEICAAIKDVFEGKFISFFFFKKKRLYIYLIVL